MKNTCDDSHDKIAYNGKECPLCDLDREYQTQAENLDSVEAELHLLKEENNEQSDELEKISNVRPFVSMVDQMQWDEMVKKFNEGG